MALRFYCDHCGKPIVTKYLDVSDEAHCRACGERTIVSETSEQVPDDFSPLPSDEAPGHETRGTAGHVPATDEDAYAHRRVLEEWKVHPTTQLYSTRAIFWFSALFSFFAGGLLLAANWRRLGQPDRSRTTLWVTGGAALAIMVIGWFAPDEILLNKLMKWLHLGLAVLLRTHTRQEQGEVLDALKATGRSPAPILRPTLLALAVIVPLGTLVYFATVYEDDYAVEEHHALGIEMQERGQIDSAMVQFQQAYALLPDDASTPAMVGQCFSRMDVLDSAAHYLEEALTIDPAFGLVHHELGTVYARQERYQDAWREFDLSDSLGVEVEPYIREFLKQELDNAGP